MLRLSSFCQFVFSLVINKLKYYKPNAARGEEDRNGNSLSEVEAFVGLEANDGHGRQ